MRTRLVLKVVRGLEASARRLRTLFNLDAARPGGSSAAPRKQPEARGRGAGQAPASLGKPGVEGGGADVRDALRGLLGSLERGRFLDLGCGDGEISLAVRDLGWEVTAVDDSLSSMPASPGVDWVEADARGFGVEGYECVCVAGLLDRMGLPGQLDLLRGCAGTPTIIAARASVEPSHKERGYEGVLEDGLSFHPTEKSLLRMVRASGFSSSTKAEQAHEPDRSFHLCV